MVFMGLWYRSVGQLTSEWKCRENKLSLPSVKPENEEKMAGKKTIASDTLKRKISNIREKQKKILRCDQGDQCLWEMSCI
jgi:hypothetical protein